MGTLITITHQEQVVLQSTKKVEGTISSSCSMEKLGKTELLFSDDTWLSRLGMIDTCARADILVEWYSARLSRVQ